ncbi:hypothetical protein Kpol_191p2 [Vanderwaltozyma polyspora DSM 70294]|uniref:Karyogamy protein KAR9 n=1 Tax=Vanderwaltozyma polyspora (strain ATCC 22028 / DSM 70294 / BCRC 21397 / CBS 2163 / NBRC 10782 / NRRL Y-8283 / UCD 57-17) TaxID=436907 RepID=A7TTL3_VANPO|nr:uncharacterized protein Kpol_191p2 [Vanderwaltozyma polyspora DSM 70294]EDO14393.1 hypothetical protein Kpol_191p2 [Vanderwaltozyma polyspora DSM 70294]
MNNEGKFQLVFSDQFDTENFHIIIESLSNVRCIDSNIAQSTEKLCNALSELELLLSSLPSLESTKDEMQLYDYVNWLLNDRICMNEFMNDSTRLDEILSNILGFINTDEETEESELLDYRQTINHLEKCNKSYHTLKPWIQSTKLIFDASLEFYEISTETIDTLSSLIEINIQKCLSIQDDRFSSPIRHAPSFTLSQLITLLESNSDSTEPKVPTLTPTEEIIFDRYMELKRSLNPIDMSLTEILPQRIEVFESRDIENIGILHSILQQKYKDVMNKYRFMMNEVRSLKEDLIDKRWNVLFISLNQELSFLLEEVEELQQKISETNFSNDTREKLMLQLENKSIVVNKTFNVIYKALEFSLLNAGVAVKTNRLARKWLEIKPLNDEILNKPIQLSEEDVEKLTNKLEKLKMEDKAEQTSNTNDIITPPKKKVGAILLKKMNIKPVIITGTPPPSAEKPNPFFDNTNYIPTEGSKDSDKIILGGIPSLSYSSMKENSLQFEDTNDEEIDRIITKERLRDLEIKKIEYFSTQASKIPIYKSKKYIPMVSSPKTPSNNNMNSTWTPYLKYGNSLKTPTPISTLFPPK